MQKFAPPGLIAYGAIGIVAIWAAREERGLKLGALAAGAVNIMLGLMFIFTESAKESWVRGLGIIVLVAGLVLLGFAYMVYRSNAGKAAIPPTAAARN